MSWHPNDLVVDADLTAYERKILTQFGASDWQARRQKALEDWLFPLLEGRGFNPGRLRTRFEADFALGITTSVATDLTSAAKAEDGLNLATILPTSSDALYIGSTEQFRGLSVRVTDNPNSAAVTLTLAPWVDAWTALASVTDGTQATAGKPFSKGGALTWTLPEGWVPRSIQNHGPCYWLKVSASAVLTGAAVGPLSVIRRSRLCAPAALRTLALIFREAPTSQDGPWLEKAEYYEREAEAAWTRVVDLIGGEFDADESDAVDADEAQQTSAEVSGGGYRFERA